MGLRDVKKVDRVHTQREQKERERQSEKMKGSSLERCVWAVKLQSKR